MVPALLGLLMGCTASLQPHQPVYTLFTEDYSGGEGFRYKIRNVSIENSGNVYTSDGMQPINVTMDILHNCISCRGAINQVIVGLSSDDKAQLSVWNGGQISGGEVQLKTYSSGSVCMRKRSRHNAQWVTVRFDINVPQQAGVYYLRSRYSQAYKGNLLREQCKGSTQVIFDEPLNWWKIDRPNGPDESANIGKIIIKH